MELVEDRPRAVLDIARSKHGDTIPRQLAGEGGTPMVILQRCDAGRD